MQAHHDKPLHCNGQNGVSHKDAEWCIGPIWFKQKHYVEMFQTMTKVAWARHEGCSDKAFIVNMFQT